MKGLVDEFGEGTKLLEADLAQVFEKWSLLSTPSRVHCGEGGYIDNILKLKKASTYDYIHDNRFLGQGGMKDIVYLFKMSTVVLGSGINLV